MRTLFVYPNLMKQEFISMGIAYLSAILKANGHKTALLDMTFGVSNKKIIKKIRRFKPDIVGFSVRSGELNYSLKLADFIKQNFGIPIIFGGVGPTVEPLKVIREESVDMICIGEGEFALLELLNKIEENKRIEKTKNIWIKKEGRIITNPVRPLVEDLDLLPFPDRKVFNFRKYLEARSGVVDFIVSRGCPFNCSYCVNPVLKKLYSGKGKFVRFRSPQNVFEEIDNVNKKYKIRLIDFQDDVFTSNFPWLKEFCKEYPKLFDIPFRCNAHVKTLNKFTCRLLKRAGCELVRIGIETGNEKIRQQILRRPITNNEVFKAIRNAKQAGLRICTYNMIGLPGETIKTIWETIKLNRKISPDSIQISIYQPYPGTDLAEFCKNLGYLTNKNIPFSHQFESILKLPTIDELKIKKFRKFFPFYVYKEKNYTKSLFSLVVEHLYPFFIRYREKIPLKMKKAIFKIFYSYY